MCKEKKKLSVVSEVGTYSRGKSRKPEIAFCNDSPLVFQGETCRESLLCFPLKIRMSI